MTTPTNQTPNPPLRTCKGCGALEKRSGPGGMFSNFTQYLGDYCVDCVNRAMKGT